MTALTNASPLTDAQPRRRRRLLPVLAIVTGGALLAGGGTTLAYWSSAVDVAGGQVASGDLNLTAGAAGTWTLQGAVDTAPRPVTDLTAVTLVPGDVLTFTQSVTVTLVGSTIAAALTVDTTSLPSGIQSQVTAAGVDAANLTAADNGAVVPVTVTLTFDPTTANRDLTNTTFDLTSLALTLTQKSQP